MLRTAGLIIIGNEILSGRVKDENIYFLCNRFHNLGIRVDKIVTVGDNVNDIAEEVRDFSRIVDIVITCGGVGPTHDDVTYEAVAAAFGVVTILNEELLLYWKRDSSENVESIIKMSSVPESSKVVYYAQIPESEKKPIIVISNVYMLPGSPKSLQSRFIGLENLYFNGNGIKFHNREIFLCVDEFLAVSSLNETVNKFPDVSIGSYPELNNPLYSARITLCSHDLGKVDDAYEMLLSLLDPSWVLEPSKFASKNKL